MPWFLNALTFIGQAYNAEEKNVTPLGQKKCEFFAFCFVIKVVTIEFGF